MLRFFFNIVTRYSSSPECYYEHIDPSMSNSTLTSQLSHVNSHVLEPRILGRNGRGSIGDKLSRRTVKWKRKICCILYVVYVDANLLFWTIPL